MKSKPAYGFHKTSGQARVTIYGKRIYLGEYNSPESLRKYEEIIAQWESEQSGKSDITLARLCVLFQRHADAYYQVEGVPSGEAHNFKCAMRHLCEEMPTLPVRQFGPRKLQQVRDAMVADGLTRSSINARVRRIRHVIRWAVSQELASSEILRSLEAVLPLRAGRTSAPEGRKKGAADEAHIAALEPWLTRPMWGMVQFMLHTGCRPSEAANLKWSEIDTTGETWVNNPAKHKTAHKEKTRIILIGPKAQQVLHSLREFTRTDMVFDPQFGLEDFVRKTYGAKAKCRKVGTKYTSHSIQSAVRVACDKAGVPRWSPGQLRKNAATKARKVSGLETAQQMLGHSSQATTERHYAAQDVAAAEEFIRVHG